MAREVRSSRYRTGSAAVFLSILGLASAGCGGKVSTFAPLSSAELLQPGPFGVGVTTRFFEDPTRSTMPNGSFPGAPTRVLVTEVWYPASPDAAEEREAPAARRDAPYPLVLYSHGFMDRRTGGLFLARHLASYGYVVAAPDFPLTHAAAPGGPNVNDAAEQPRDVSFVLDRLLAESAEGGGLLGDLVDRHRIGAMGLSLGGLTTVLVALHPRLRDTRIAAAAAIGAPGCLFGERFYGNTRVPLLLLHGDLDAIVSYAENAVHAFSLANPPKYLVTVHGGSHTAFSEFGSALAADNPDDIGCLALTSRLGPPSAGPTWIERLGGAEMGIVQGDCPLPCTDPLPRPRALSGARHRELAILSILSFFEAYLRLAAPPRDFLENRLAVENPEVSVRWAR